MHSTAATKGTPGQDIPLSIDSIKSNFHFTNKLWNAGKYVGFAISSLSESEKQNMMTEVNYDYNSSSSDSSSNSSSSGSSGSRKGLQVQIDHLPLAERYIVSQCHALILSGKCISLSLSLSLPLSLSTCT